MELIVLLVMMFLGAVVVSVEENRMSKSLLSVFFMFFGLLVFMEGLSYGSTTITAVNTVNNYALFVFMTFGSLLTAYSVLTK